MSENDETQLSTSEQEKVVSEAATRREEDAALARRLADTPILGQSHALAEETDLARLLRATNTELFFSRYAEDGRLRLFKVDSMLSDESAGYSDAEVVVKVLVRRPKEKYLVILPVTRRELDSPDAEYRLACAAFNYRT